MNKQKVDYELTGEQYETGVHVIVDPKEKEEIATGILNDLPEWFGLPESTKQYITESRNLPFFAFRMENQYVGFIVLKETGEKTAEILVMGVLKKYHRRKIGEKLWERFVTYAKNCGYEYLQVKTVDEGHYKEYDRTRLFYEEMGFRKLECFPTLWDEWNPCLVMVQSVKTAEEGLRRKRRVYLTELNEQNMGEVLKLKVTEEQKQFVPSAEGIAARAWTYRKQQAKLFVIATQYQPVGLIMVYELEEEPCCYCLMEMMIDASCQRLGYGEQALKQIIEYYAASPKYPRIELSVDRKNIGAIQLYKKAGFVDSGYVDPELLQYINMVYQF